MRRSITGQVYQGRTRAAIRQMYSLVIRRLRLLQELELIESPHELLRLQTPLHISVGSFD